MTAIDLEHWLLSILDNSLCFLLVPELEACTCSDNGLLLVGRVREISAFFFFLTGESCSCNVEEDAGEVLQEEEEEERLERYSWTRASPKSNTVELEASLLIRLTGLVLEAGWVEEHGVLREEVPEEVELKELEVEEKLRELSLETFLFFLRCASLALFTSCSRNPGIRNRKVRCWSNRGAFL